MFAKSFARMQNQLSKQHQTPHLFFQRGFSTVWPPQRFHSAAVVFSAYNRILALKYLSLTAHLIAVKYVDKCRMQWYNLI